MHEYPPCYGCTDKHEYCHGSCEAYKEWKVQHDAQQKHLRQVRNQWGPYWSPYQERTYRRENKYGGYGHGNGGKQ